jgi:dCMP deaminase
MQRISFKQMAINFAINASLRSEDKHKKVGCAILNKEGRLLSIGYNGLLPKQKIKNDFWNDRDYRRKYIIHAEINALSCITRYDNPYLLACTLLPCSNCASNIVSNGIKEVLYVDEYIPDQNAHDIFDFYKIKLTKFNK